MKRQREGKNLSVNEEKLVVFFQVLYRTLPNSTHPRDMIAYLTQNFPTIHGCNCGSGMPMLIELHKAVWIMTLCLQWAREARIPVTVHQHYPWPSMMFANVTKRRHLINIYNWANKTIRTKFIRENTNWMCCFHQNVTETAEIETAGFWDRFSFQGREWNKVFKSPEGSLMQPFLWFVS